MLSAPVLPLGPSPGHCWPPSLSRGLWSAIQNNPELEFLSQELKLTLGVGRNHSPPDDPRAPWSHPSTVRG